MKSKVVLLTLILTAVFCSFMGSVKSQVIYIHFMDTMRYQVVDSSTTYMLYEKYWTGSGIMRINLKHAIYYPYFIVATKDTRDTIYPELLYRRHYFWD